MREDQKVLNIFFCFIWTFAFTAGAREAGLCHVCGQLCPAGQLFLLSG